MSTNESSIACAHISGGANHHHGDHDANSAAVAAAAAADDDETNAKTRATRTELDQSKRKRDKPVTFTTSGSAKH